MSPGYEAAVEGVAVFDRDDRVCFGIRGRAPGRMLDGILTGTLPSPPERSQQGVPGGRASYTTALTPKGRMVTDGRLWLLGAEEAGGFLLDVPVSGREGLSAHFRKYLPPRMASVEDLTGRIRLLSVVGPEAAGRLASLAFGDRMAPEDLSGLSEGDWRQAGENGPVVARWADVWPEAFDVMGPMSAVDALIDALVASGAVAAERDAWTTLRIEAGRPAFGVEMDEGTIPVEAGIHERAIDYGKGCYTGQEVIVRIRDRGHVNRSLRLVRLGRTAPPPPGSELFAAGGEKAAASVASAVRSPRFGETIALAYVRRGVDEAALAL